VEAALVVTMAAVVTMATEAVVQLRVTRMIKHGVLVVTLCVSMGSGSARIISVVVQASD
jgi:hypothetical protein